MFLEQAGQGGGAGASVAGDVVQGQGGAQAFAHVGLGDAQAARHGVAGVGLPGVGLVVEQVQDQRVFQVLQPGGGRTAGAVVQGGEQVDQAGHHAAPGGPDGRVQAQRGAEVQGAGSGLAEGALAHGFQLAARDLQQQLFAARFPVQPQTAVGGDDGGAVGVGIDAFVAAFDAGAAAQGDLHQHEILEAVGFDVDFGAVAQRTDRQRAEAAPVELRVHAAALPGQAVFLQGFGHARARLVLMGGAEDALLEQGRQRKSGPAVHGCLRDGTDPVSEAA
ncbi:hypothetical protein D3C72_1534120 [compost metagenome]